MSKEHQAWRIAITFYLEKLDIRLLKKVHSIVKTLCILKSRQEEAAK